MRAIVTGGAGFIGSHVAEACIAHGYETHVLDNLWTGEIENVPVGADFHEEDIRTPEHVFEQVRPHAVFHLAALADIRKSIENPFDDADTNLLGTLRIIEEARKHDAKVVFASTGGAIYGETTHPGLETDTPMPLSPYGTSKLCAEQYLETWARLYGTDHVSLRFANVYGPRQDSYGEAGVVAIFMRAMRDGLSATIYGDGSQVRDYVYVSDVAESMIAAHRHSPHPVYNIATGVETSVSQLHGLLQGITGDTLDPFFKPPRLGELQRGVLDPLLAIRRLSAHRTPLVQGLKQTWEEFPND